MAFRTMSVVTSELPGTPAPADEATIVASTIVANVVGVLTSEPECDAALVVHADAECPGAVSRQRFEAIAARHANSRRRDLI